MADIIIGIIVGLAVFRAARYIYRAKKSGVKCIGCPDGATCASKSAGSCSGCNCGCNSEIK